jgi:P4 family phage/plasmid primase-like protien
LNEYCSQNTDVTSEQIDLVKKGYSDAREKKTLHPEFIIHFTDGTESSVAVILANLDEYHGKECSDPFEPDYRNGAQVGKLYLLDVNVPFIKSQAHGGYSVFLQSEKERTASMAQEFTASLSTIPFEKPDLHKADARDGTLTTRPLTEKGNAQRLYDLHCDKLRFVFDTGMWLMWRDGTWLGSDGAAVQSLAAALSNQIYFEAATHQNDQENFAKWSRESQKLRTIKNAVELLSTVEAIRLSVSSLDSDHMKIGFDRARQVIDLQTGKVRKTEPFDYITKSMTPDTVGSACKAVRWLKFLNEIFLNDHELINWMQRFCGYVLTGLTQEHFFIFCYGQGANGKSVFIDILKKIMGDYGRVTSSATFTDKNRKSSDATPELVALVGARLVTSSESEYNAPLAEALTKGLTSGDPMSVRQLQGKTFEFVPRFKTVMFGNHKPVIRGTDNGIWRRIRLIPFDRIFSEDERDPNLFQKLEQEMPHILAWMIEGCISWQREGLRDIPQRVQQATAEYKADQDVIGNWLSDNTTRDMLADTSNKAYYEDYSEWCRKSGYRALNKKNLTTKLKDDHGFIEGVRSGRDGRSLRGLKLNAFL